MIPVVTRPFRMVFAGVGGQGCVTAARVVGRAAMATGLSARVGELHGLSQRGGSVQCTVVVGPGRTARIEAGTAQVLLALEPLEALRALPYVGRETRVLVNLGKIVPFPLTLAGTPYPSMDSILTRLSGEALSVTPVDAAGIASAAGNRQAENVAMLGALSALGVLPVPGEALLEAVDRTSPERHRAANRSAFAAGRDVVLKESGA